MKTIPDYGVSQSQVSSPDIDNAELAARLGIDWFRRTGRVVYWDTCDSLSPWFAEAPGDPPGSVTVDNTKSFAGVNSFHLVPSSLGGSVYIVKYFPSLCSTVNLNSKIGIDFYYTSTYQGSSTALLQINCQFAPLGLNQYSNNVLRFDMMAGTVQYWNGSSFQTVTLPYTLPLVDSVMNIGYIWHNIKAVIGWGKYYRLYFDGLEITLNKTVSLPSSPTFKGTQFELFYEEGEALTALWLDNIIFSVDEA